MGTARNCLFPAAVMQDLAVSDVSDVSDLELSDNEAAKSKPSLPPSAAKQEPPSSTSAPKVPLSARSVSVKVLANSKNRRPKFDAEITHTHVYH